MWHIFKHALGYLIIDDSFKLFITFQGVEDYLNEKFEVYELIKLANQSK